MAFHEGQHIRSSGWLGVWGRIETVRLRSTRPGSLLWTRNVNHRIGALIALLLRSTSVSPNWLSVAGFVVHVLGALYVSLMTAPVSTPDILLVLVIWQVAFGFDCADGQLARERRQSSSFGAWLDQVADFGSHVAVLAALGVFLARSSDLSSVSVTLMVAFVLGTNLLGLFATSQRNSLMANVPPINQGKSPWLAVAMQGRHLTDYGAFLFVASLLLVAPHALTVFLVILGTLTALSVVSQVVLNWSR